MPASPKRLRLVVLATMVTPLLTASPAGARLGEQRPDGRGLKLGGPALSP